MKTLIAALLAGVLAAPTLAQDVSRDTPLDRLTRRDELSGWEAVGRIDIRGGGFCTGTLIAPDLVLTAGHCLVSKPGMTPIDPRNIRFRAGLSDGHAVAERAVLQTVVHPGYYDPDNDGFDSVHTDIGLMKLARPVPTVIASPFAVGERGIGEAVSVVSYARGRAEALSWQRSCSVLAADDLAAAFSCDVTFGSSGAPVFDTSRRRPMIVSVISRGTRHGGKSVVYGPQLEKPIAELREALRVSRGVNLAGGGVASVIQRTEGARFVRPGDGARFIKP